METLEYYDGYKVKKPSRHLLWHAMIIIKREREREIGINCLPGRGSCRFKRPAQLTEVEGAQVVAVYLDPNCWLRELSRWASRCTGHGIISKSKTTATHGGGP